MTLGELAFACYVYDKAYGDKAYIDFLSSTNNCPNLSEDEHFQALFKFLNKWGCRLPKDKDKEYRDRTCQNIKSWYMQYKDKLPKKDRNLLGLNEQELDNANCAYENLKSRNAGTRSIAETTASKILFAIRPKSLIPWDNKIREDFLKKNVNGSYAGFVRSMCDTVKELCRNYGFKPEQLLEELGKKNLISLKSSDTVPKLIDEYNWITITKECTTPDKQTLERWLLGASRTYRY